MSRASHNWERLVRATLQREQPRSAGQRIDGRYSNALSGAIPPSLGKKTNIDGILQAADEIQDEDPTVARILCEQAYSMAQNLDPKSDGRGVLQFKTGLMCLIKQKLSERCGSKIDQNHDIERLLEFYQAYKRRMELRYLEMKKLSITLRALLQVMEAMVDEMVPDGVGGRIVEELRKVKRSDATWREDTTFNIIPLDAPSPSNAIGLFPEKTDANTHI